MHRTPADDGRPEDAEGFVARWTARLAAMPDDELAAIVEGLTRPGRTQAEDLGSGPSP